MEPELKKDERELLRLTRFFKKHAENFLSAGKIEEGQAKQLMESCEKLETSLRTHANYRQSVEAQRENLKTIIKDNAVCPECGSSQYLKFVGTAKHERGWESNKYRCRKDNIEFVWNRPNNPWDMLLFID